ncbi:uncharacterized protein PGTG_18405 [Puccinia graminis f. sp. tritici CRL 75-36-700-3]|uniref:Uncharacterized protein n=1 Tax=Puccinia graminis f. sp. tritici (strain CRL 75-36-700-3 / race SCCL) TaxID=418459 RepID=E3L5X9_PUCGT|nr:uncharacterized protein PGTG_18405 [Puccinia graminis f. sp. tritici CRL 75-36-700-3]EFP91954.1 hypothetical protein PGTG_18405 [Puccinia graminis f. sp. tritici CRL 75-36-700-3]
MASRFGLLEKQFYKQSFNKFRAQESESLIELVEDFPSKSTFWVLIENWEGPRSDGKLSSKVSSTQFPSGPILPTPIETLWTTVNGHFYHGWFISNCQDKWGTRLSERHLRAVGAYNFERSSI